MGMELDRGLADRLSGAVWGHLIGDAVGVPYEFGPPVPAASVVFGRPGTHGRPPGTWSDDGAMMLALLDSLLTVGFDPADQGDALPGWADDGAYTPDGEGKFDIGNATAGALDRVRGGIPAEEAGGDETTLGNGSLMRTLPIALVGHDLAPADLVEQASRASAVTHASAVARTTCALYVLIAADLLRGRRDRAAALRDCDRHAPQPRGGCRTGRPRRDPRLADPRGSRPRRRCLLVGLGCVRRRRHPIATRSSAPSPTGRTPTRPPASRAASPGRTGASTASRANGRAGCATGSRSPPPSDRLLEPHGWRTSSSHPLRLDTVDLSAVPGLAAASGILGMTFLPGKRRDGWTGPWWRDLDEDGDALRSAHGVDALLLLVEDHELESCGVPDIADRLPRDHGVQVLRHPVVDMGVPVDPWRIAPSLPTSWPGRGRPDGRGRLSRWARADRDGRGLPPRHGRPCPERRDRPDPSQPPRHHRAQRAGGLRPRLDLTGEISDVLQEPG